MTSRSPMHLRSALETDQARLESLYRIARQWAFHWCDPGQFHLEDFERDTQGEEVTVAEQAGRILGFIALTAPGEFIHHLYVDPAFHRQGVGSRLLEDALANSPSGSCRLKCIQRNRRAVRFYKGRGWKIIGTGEGPLGDYFLMTGSPVDPPFAAAHPSSGNLPRQHRRRSPAHVDTPRDPARRGGAPAPPPHP